MSYEFNTSDNLRVIAVSPRNCLATLVSKQYWKQLQKTKALLPKIVGTALIFFLKWYRLFDESLLCRESTKRLVLKIDSMHYLFLRLAFFFIWLANNPSS